MDRQVKFSVRIHQSGYSYESLRRVWKDADRLGYYSASLYDLLNIPTLECWTTLSALAAETQPLPAARIAGENGGHAGRYQWRPV